jgi:HPt (histidine-containing phosphotransfer) domain-containing protein
MEKALLQGDLKPVLHIAHGLKGTLALFGARPPIELAQRVEILAARGSPAGMTDLIGTLNAEVDHLVAALQQSRA